MSTINSREAVKENEAYQYEEMMQMGPWTTSSVLHDPIHTVFVLSRYKFIARMISGKKHVVEVGCGDAPGTPIVAQFVNKVTAVDIDKRIIEINTQRLSRIPNISFQYLDILEKSLNEEYDAVYSIDVLEHIDPHLSDTFIEKCSKGLHTHGICIIGTPNKTSEQYASKQSKKYHINLQTHTTLRALMERHFHNVFLFSMNDEVVHTGYYPMAHYLFGVGVGLK